MSHGSVRVLHMLSENLKTHMVDIGLLLDYLVTPKLKPQLFSLMSQGLLWEHPVLSWSFWLLYKVTSAGLYSSGPYLLMCV